jgi:transcription elongation GreA/GreB family factor
VIVKDEKSGVKETYTWVFGDGLELEDGQVTMAAPSGKALLGKKTGEIAFLRLPAGMRQLKVVELQTIHDLGQA